MPASLPVWELEPWRFDETATAAEVDDRRARAVELVEAGHRLGPDAHVSRLAVVDCDLLELGARTYVAALAHVSGRVRLGDDCSVNTGAAVRGDVRTGRAVRIGAYATVLGFDHGFADTGTEIFRQPLTSRGIQIGDDVWIGAHVVVRDGVRIGSHAVVGAGAVVTRDVPEWAVVVGNPARPVRDRRHGPLTESGDTAGRLGDRLRTAIPWILDRSFVDGWYRDHPGAPRTVRAHTDAVELADLAQAGPPPQLTPQEHVRRLGGLQVPASGLVDELDPRDGADGPVQPRERAVPVELPEPTVRALPDQVRAYHVLAVGYALMLLGERFAVPVQAVTAMPPAQLVEELDRLPWADDAWGAGALVDSVGTALTWAYLDDPGSVRGSLEALVGWVLTRQDPGTGLWGSTAGGLLEPVNGAFRLVRGTLAQWGVVGTRPAELTDSVLRRAAELTERSSACDALDVVHLLWWAGAHLPGYRASERSAVATAVLGRAAAAWVDGHGWGFVPGQVPSLRGTQLWSSAAWYAADLLGESGRLGYRPRGVHRPEPLIRLGRPDVSSRTCTP